MKHKQQGVYSKKEMNFSIYKNIYEHIITMGDFRERIIQEFLIRPFLESVVNYDVIPTDTKVSNKNKIHDYGKYSGKGSNEKTVTPDLCIVKNWEWANREKEKIDYKATVEVKTPKKSILSCYINVENNHNIINSESFKKKLCKNTKMHNEINTHLKVIENVILTDGIGWHFFKGENGSYIIDSYYLGVRKINSQGNIIGIEWNATNGSIFNVSETGMFVGEIINFEKLKKKIKDVIC